MLENADGYKQTTHYEKCVDRNCCRHNYHVIVFSHKLKIQIIPWKQCWNCKYSKFEYKPLTTWIYCESAKLYTWRMSVWERPIELIWHVFHANNASCPPFSPVYKRAISFHLNTWKRLEVPVIYHLKFITMQCKKNYHESCAIANKW